MRCKPHGLRHGPDGDLESKDPFEYAQARATEGWHVEGQFLGRYMATTCGAAERVYGSTPEALVEAMRKAGPRR